MTKFRYILGAIALSACCMSCEKEESSPRTTSVSDRILFDSPVLTVESITRSTFKNSLDAGDAFGVLGYCVPYTVGTSVFNYNAGSSLWTIKRAQCPPEVFYAQKVVVGLNGCTYDRNGGTDNDPKYWYRDGYDTDNIPNAAVTDADSYRYSFIAYYPCDGSFTIDRPSGPTAAGAPVLTFSMPQTGGSVSGPLDHRQTPDAMLAVLYDRRKADGNLRFNFSHVLTGLGVEVNNFSEHDLQIHSVTLSGDFYKEVRIDLTGDVSTFSFPETYYAGTYTFFDGTPAGSYLELPAPKPESGETVTSSGLIGNEHLLLISGAENPGFFGEGVEIRLDYTFAGVRKQYETERPGTFTPRPGTRYTAQFNFVGDAFVLQFVVDNQEQWEDGEAGDNDETNDDVIFE